MAHSGIDDGVNASPLFLNTLLEPFQIFVLHGCVLVAVEEQHRRLTPVDEGRDLHGCIAARRAEHIFQVGFIRRKGIGAGKTGIARMGVKPCQSRLPGIPTDSYGAGCRFSETVVSFYCSQNCTFHERPLTLACMENRNFNESRDHRRGTVDAVALDSSRRSKWTVNLVAIREEVAMSTKGREAV